MPQERKEEKFAITPTAKQVDISTEASFFELCVLLLNIQKAILSIYKDNGVEKIGSETVKQSYCRVCSSETVFLANINKPGTLAPNWPYILAEPKKPTTSVKQTPSFTPG